MVFSSMFFMCVFLPVVFILHCVLPGIRMKNALLLLASVFFYAYGEPVYIILLFISTLLNYFCARLIEGSRYKKGVLILAVIWESLSYLNIQILSWEQSTACWD